MTQSIYSNFVSVVWWVNNDATKLDLAFDVRETEQFDFFIESSVSV